MRTATTIEASAGDRWAEHVDFVVEAEKLGLDICWVAEAWGSDGPSALGFYAARTDRMLLGSGIMQVGTRTPVAVAQTAITLSNLSDGRFLLGLGASGPQVIEGLHGVPFARPLARTRETVEIVRRVLEGGKISYSGGEFQIPRPGGNAVPMRLSMRAHHPIPIYLATLSPAMLRLTGEIADGWLGTSFVPEGAAGAYFRYLDEGLAGRGRSRADLDVCQGAEVAFAPDEDELRRMVAGRKKELAFSLGGMGSASTNFYNKAYSRQGWAEIAAEVRERWQAGDRDGAAALVTDDMVLGTTLIGTEPMVRERLRVWRDAGVNTVRLYPAGDTLDARLSTLAKAIDLVREIGEFLVTDWHKTACNLCYVNCALEVQTEGRAITRIRGDKDNPRTAGYLCQKPQRLTWYGDHDDRLTTPMRRRADGTHEAVSWETALTEIAARLRAVRDEDVAEGRPGSFAYVGGGGQGNHSGGGYGHALMRWMNATRFFGALSQEKTGDFWVNGKLYGGQTCHTSEGVEDCDLLVVIGCNPWLANGFNRARNVVNTIKNDPGRKMIVLDPRRTETAAVADVHLSLRPGTDAYLLGAILALIIERHGEDERFLATHTEGFDRVAAALRHIPVDAWIAHAEVERADVERAVDLIVAAGAMTVRVELGIQQGRNSTLNSYLEKLLYLVTGNFGRPGTNALHSWLVPLWGESRGQRSEITGFEYIGGYLPLNTLAEEILADHPHRARVLWVESSNPANTAADTAMTERAIRQCELSVVVDVAYTETAALADYVLPAASQFEKWEWTFFDFEWPTNYFHLRRPVFDPLPGTLVEAEIYARLFDELGLLPDQATLDRLAEVARDDRPNLLKHAGPLLRDNPAIAPVLLYRTLGRTLPDGAASAAILWPGCHTAAKKMTVPVQRALGTDLTGPALGEELFDRVLASPSGFAFSTHEYDEIWTLVRNQRIQLAVPELLDWLTGLDPDRDGTDPDYPLSLVNGQRRRHNANQILRPPAWRRTDPDGALRVRTEDLAALGAADGEWVAVVTRTGRIVVRAEIDDSLRRRQVALPHGYGMSVPDGHGGRVTHGPRINLITDVTDRDPIAGTPHHKDVSVRLERVTPVELANAERDRDRVRQLISQRS